MLIQSALVYITVITITVITITDLYAHSEPATTRAVLALVRPDKDDKLIWLGDPQCAEMDGQCRYCAAAGVTTDCPGLHAHALRQVAVVEATTAGPVVLFEVPIPSTVNDPVEVIRLVRNLVRNELRATVS